MEFKTIQKIVYQNVPTVYQNVKLSFHVLEDFKLLPVVTPTACAIWSQLDIYLSTWILMSFLRKSSSTQEDYTKSHLQCTTVLPILKNSHFLYIIKSYIMSHHGLSPSHALCFWSALHQNEFNQLHMASSMGSYACLTRPMLHITSPGKAPYEETLASLFYGAF